MSKYIALFISTLLYISSVTGQTKGQLLSDLNFLNEAVTKGHPVNYKQKGSTNIVRVIEEAKGITSDSLTAFEYTKWIKRGVFAVGCVHTSIRKNPLLRTDSSFRYFPCALKSTQAGVFINNCADSNRIGEEILSVNGVEIAVLKAHFAAYRASDGGTDAFSKLYFDYAPGKLFSRFFENPDKYRIHTETGIYTIDAVVQPITKKAIVNLQKPLLKNNANYLFIKGDTAVLRVRSFSSNDRSFFRQCFEVIAEEKQAKLLIDLRLNTGGDRGASIELMKFLANAEFGYSILQPQLPIKQYLNKKGRRYLSLSKLKYNVGNVLRGKKTTLGRSFQYSYKPRKKHHFDGEIFVLTDGFTASSATMFTSWLKQFSDATFYGTQASGGYNGNNGGSFPLITLPGSQMIIRFPAYRLIFDENSGQNEGVIPDHFIDGDADYDTVLKRIQFYKS